jgi:hypothetical protein
MKFSLSNCLGSRAAVKATIAAQDKLPEPMRTALVALVDDLPPEFNGARVDAHCSDLRGVQNLHITIAPLKLTLPPE